MLPGKHFIIGLILSILIKLLILPNINWFYIGVIIAANVLIDFDHYMASCFKTSRILTLKQSYAYHDKQIEWELKNKERIPGDFHIFHTLEAHLLVLFMGLIHPFFHFVFLGMLMHSATDMYDLIKGDRLYRREFFFFNWFINGRKQRKYT
jgi:hypothetical protein